MPLPPAPTQRASLLATQNTLRSEKTSPSENHAQSIEAYLFDTQ